MAIVSRHSGATRKRRTRNLLRFRVRVFDATGNDGKEETPTQKTVRNAQDGLESVKKTNQVAGVARQAPARCFSPATPTAARRDFKGRGFNRPGYLIDDGPRNEAPGDAGGGVFRRGADRPDRDLLAARPQRLARGGRGADPRRHRA